MRWLSPAVRRPLILLCLPLASVTVLAFQRAGPNTRLGGGDHEPYLQVGPFQEGDMEELQQIVVDNSGVLTLEPSSTGYRYSGRALVKPITFEQPANSFQFGIVGQGGPNTDVMLEARVRKDASHDFSGWTRLGNEGEITTLEPVTEVQLRLLLTCSSGRETPRVWGLSVSSGLSIAMDTLEPGESANVPAPTIISRAAWGASKAKGEYTNHTPRKLVVHHSTEPDVAAYRGAASVKGIQDFHMNSRGWMDIGYHFLVGPDGKIFQGRPETVVGAHSPPNVDMVGICVIGNYEPGKDPLSADTLESLNQLLAHLCGKYQIKTAGIFGHRNFRQTDCPGGVLYGKLPEIRVEVDRRLTAAQQQ